MVSLTLKVCAQDIMGAYIRTESIPCVCTYPVYEYSITVTLLADASKNIVRPTIPIKYGTGATGTLTLSSSSFTNGINIKTYTGTYVYPGTSIYPLSYLDTFRVAGIKNLSNSEAQQISVKETIDIENWSQPNTSPKLSNYPFSYTVSGNQVLYDPEFVDADGDSLSYELTNCLPSSDYRLPNGAAINPATGLFNFSKDSIGRYAFSFIIREWREDMFTDYNNIAATQMDFVMDINTPVGIEEHLLNDLNLKIFPNPVTDKLRFEAQQDVWNDARLIILNGLGQPVLSFNAPGKKQELDLSALASGIYFLSVQTGTGQKAFKFIKE